MRILFIAPHPFFAPRGTPIAVLAAARVLAGAGHRIDLLTYFQGEDVDIPNVRMLRIRRPPFVRSVPIGVSWQKLPCDAYLAVAAARLVRANRYDLVHAVEEGAFIAWWIRNRAGIPYVFDMDSCMSEQVRNRGRVYAPAASVFQWLERRTIRDAAGVVAVCRTLVDYARAHHPAGPVALLPDPPVTAITGTGSPAPAREAVARIASVQGVKILYVGNLESYQGVDLLLDAFERVAAENLDAQLIIAGGDAAGIARLARQAAAASLGGRVHLIGPTPLEALDEVLSAADILVSPRRSGTNTPMKIYSYMLSGRPILATAIPAHAQVLEESVAVLTEPTAVAMAEGLRRLLADASLRRRISSAASVLATATYSHDAYRRRLLDFYSSLENGREARIDSRPDTPTRGPAAVSPVA
ncbi:MAG TPA: glycosyltransferase [Longimicrobiales bacterium]|nr:glycosyltransferase [Longimicrobiales bacterium]